MAGYKLGRITSDIQLAASQLLPKVAAIMSAMGK